MIQVIHSLEWL